MTDRQSFIYKEEAEDVILQIRTLSPTKWLLIDRETGQSYQGNPNGYWDKLSPVVRVDK